MSVSDKANPYSSRLAMIGSKDRSVAWYDVPITTVDEPVRDLLENYSQIPSDEVIPRIIETRDQIWDIFPWPCVGQFRFLDLSLLRNPAYPSILHRLTHDNDRILDVGCCLAQDLRQLAHDGAPPSSLFGLEKQAEFIPIGHSFFNDVETFGQATFIAADLLDRENEEVRKVAGTFGIVNLSMMLHIWDLENQIKACERVVELLRDEKGVLVVGQSVGDLAGKEVGSRGVMRIFKHNVETFEKMWEEVGKRTGTKWKVDATLKVAMGIDSRPRNWDEPSTRRLAFCVERV